VDLDVADPDAAADVAESLGAAEVVAGDRPEFRSLRRPTGMPVRLLVQRLDGGDGPTTGHPDLACADREVEVAAHVRLGARVVAPGWGWTVMRDPVGQVYCLTDRSPSSGV
jgi:Glyoxalase-like domain